MKFNDREQTCVGLNDIFSAYLDEETTGWGFSEKKTYFKIIFIAMVGRERIDHTLKYSSYAARMVDYAKIVEAINQNEQ